MHATIIFFMSLPQIDRFEIRSDKYSMPPFRRDQSIQRGDAVGSIAEGYCIIRL
jgi:hypothetical protein